MLAKEMLAVAGREACISAFIPPAPWSSHSMASMSGEQNTNSYVNGDYSEEWRGWKPGCSPTDSDSGDFPLEHGSTQL